MPTIAFICTANLCRSPMAHAIFASEVSRRGLDVSILSAGVEDYSGCLAEERARVVCACHATPMPKMISTYAGELPLAGVDRVFAMEHRHVQRLLNVFAVPPERLHLLGDHDPHRRGAGIPDPIGDELEVYEQCYLRLRDCIHHYLDTTEDFGRPPA